MVPDRRRLGIALARPACGSQWALRMPGTPVQVERLGRLTTRTHGSYPCDSPGQRDRGRAAEVGFAACRRPRHERPGRDRGAPGARGVGDHPAVDAGRRPRHGRPGRRPRAAWSSRCSTSRSRQGVPEDGHIADRLLAVPFRQVRERGFEAHDDGTPLVVVDVETELRVLGRRGASTAIDDAGVELRRPRRLRDRRRRVRQARRGDHPRRDRPGRGRQPRHRPALPRHRRRLGRRQGADRLPAAARARARRLLDLLLLHRRPLPDRRQPRAARHACTAATSG